MENNRKVIEISFVKIFGLVALLAWGISMIGLYSIDDNSDAYMPFMGIIIFSSVPAFIYFLSAVVGVVRGGIKFLIYRKVEEKVIVKSEKEIDEAEAEKQAIKSKELKRQETEKYSSEKLKTRWTVAPLLMFFGAGIYILIVYFSSGKEYIFDGFNTAMVIIGVLGLADIWGISLQDDWEKTLEIKREIYEENPEYKFYEGYDYDLVYTDSRFNYIFFRFGKFLAYFLGVAGIAIIIGLLISLISGISISPTTIIIFLLIMIYLEVKKRNENDE